MNQVRCVVVKAGCTLTERSFGSSETIEEARRLSEMLSAVDLRIDPLKEFRSFPASEENADDLKLPVEEPVYEVPYEDDENWRCFWRCFRAFLRASSSAVGRLERRSFGANGSLAGCSDWYTLGTMSMCSRCEPRGTEPSPELKLSVYLRYKTFESVTFNAGLLEVTRGDLFIVLPSPLLQLCSTFFFNVGQFQVSCAVRVIIDLVLPSRDGRFLKQKSK